jgi:hypothetical protein
MLAAVMGHKHRTGFQFPSSDGGSPMFKREDHTSPSQKTHGGFLFARWESR